MIKITYDPNTGLTLPDNKIDEYIKKKIKISKNKIIELCIGSDLIICGFRAHIKQKLISHINIKLFFEKEELYIDNEGGIDYWPNDYTDIMDDYLKILVWE